MYKYPESRGVKLRANVLVSAAAVGDVGTISHCIPGTDDDAAEECESCFREREEKEDENGEMKNEIMSSTQVRG